MIKKRTLVRFFLFLFLFCTIFYPLLVMVCKIKWSDFSILISSASFRQALGNSFLVTLLATFFSISIAYLLAYTIHHTNRKHKEILKILITLPMLIPSISHGLGLLTFMGSNGLFSKYFGFNIVGFWGIVIGSVLYTFPVAFLILSDGFCYIDSTMYEVCKILGFTKWQTFRKVTFCSLKKALLSAIFAVFTLIFTDYGVPLAVGGKFITLPVYLYKEVMGLLHFSSGTIISLFLLIPAFFSFLFDIFCKDYTTTSEKSYSPSKNKWRDRILTIFTYGILLFTFLILGSFIYYAFIDNIILHPTLSFDHFSYVLDNNLISYLCNSLWISFLVAIFGTILSYLIAYFTARDKKYKSMHILAISSLAIPGMVLGLSYTISFNHTIFYHTFLILVLVNIVHFMASPYLMAYNALKKLDPNYETVGKVCNIRTFYILKDVIIPNTKGTIREMFAYFFVNSMITISAVAFLYNTRTMPLSLLIPTYEGNLMLAEAAVVSFVILLVNLLIKGSISILNRKERRIKYEK